MLISSVGQFGQLGQTSSKLTAEQEAQVPRFISAGELDQATEQRLLRTYTKLNLAVRLVGPNAAIPVTLLQKYMDARTAYLEAAGLWLGARAQTPKDQLPDPSARPTPPPAFVIPSGTRGLAGAFGQAVRASDIQVVYGPIGAEQMTSLSDAPALNDLPEAAEDLGNPLLLPLLWIVGLAVTGLVIAVGIKMWRSGEVAKHRSISDQAAARSKEVASDNDTFVQTLTACISTSVDPKVSQRCTELATRAMTEGKKGRPQIKIPGGIGFFAVVGVITVIGAVTAVGYTMYRRRRHQQPTYSEPDESPGKLRREV